MYKENLRDFSFSHVLIISERHPLSGLPGDRELPLSSSPPWAAHSSCLGLLFENDLERSLGLVVF